jgi:signal transduction histidine kinase/CheY-like chemotaxis protein/HPt (histidine-containing phosphotransfer) domain-containing protein
MKHFATFPGKHFFYGLFLGLLCSVFLYLQVHYSLPEIIFWLILIAIPAVSAIAGIWWGFITKMKTAVLQKQKNKAQSLERNATELNRSMDAIYMELEEKVRQLALVQAKRDALEKSYNEIWEKLRQQGIQFQRIQKEMENQLDARSQIELELLNSQTRLELINSLSSGLFSNSSFKRILFQALKKAKNIFPQNHIYYAAIDSKNIICWHDLNTTGSGLNADLNQAPEYLQQLEHGELVEYRNISRAQELSLLMPYFSSRNIQYCIEIPIICERKACGLIGFGSKVPHRWTNHETKTLEELGRFLAMAKKTTELENERARAIQKLLIAKKTAEEATKAKSVFLSTLSHEIRTPLNGVIGMTELVMNTELNAEQEEYASIAHTSGKVLLALVNDILDFSKIEAGQLELEHAEFNLRETFEKACELLAFQAQNKGLELISCLPHNLPELVIGDSVRFRQILINLITNAVKFTETGHVLLETVIQSMAPERICLQINITDTGIGISPENLKRLFKSFSQADSSTTRRFGGTGLGLTISKQLVELMKGKIWVTSDPGKGSTFSFALDMPIPATITSNEDAPTKTKGTIALFISYPELDKSMELLCKSAGYQPICLTKTDLSALPLLEPHRENLIATIWNQKDVDQLSQSEKLELFETYSSCTHLMLAPLNRKISDQVCRFHILKKPVQLQRLFQALEGKNSTHTKETIHQQTHQVDEHLILLVDDHAINRKLCGTYLKKAGYSFREACDGQEAIEALEQVNFHLILMDCRMPVMDGFEATRIIRAKEGSLDHIPIIALTANVMKSEKERCFAAGMDGFLTKPLDRKALLQTIEEFLKIDTPKQRTPNHRKSAGKPLPSEHVAIEEYLDLTPLTEATAGDKELIEELLDLLVEDVEESLEKAEKALKENDFTFLSECAHGIKGASANAGALKLTHSAKKLEKAATDEEKDSLPSLLLDVRNAFQKTLKAIEQTKNNS